MTFKEWIIKGVSASDGSMDDARIHAGFLVISYIVLGIYGLYTMIHGLNCSAAELANFMQAYGVGAAAMAGGIGAWFGLRKDN